MRESPSASALRPFSQGRSESLCLGAVQAAQAPAEGLGLGLGLGMAMESLGLSQTPGSWSSCLFLERDRLLKASDSCVLSMRRKWLLFVVPVNFS